MSSGCRVRVYPAYSKPLSRSVWEFSTRDSARDVKFSLFFWALGHQQPQGTPDDLSSSSTADTNRVTSENANRVEFRVSWIPIKFLLPTYFKILTVLAVLHRAPLSTAKHSSFQSNHRMGEILAKETQHTFPQNELPRSTCRKISILGFRVCQLDLGAYEMDCCAILKARCKKNRGTKQLARQASKCHACATIEAFPNMRHPPFKAFGPSSSLFGGKNTSLEIHLLLTPCRHSWCWPTRVGGCKPMHHGSVQAMHLHIIYALGKYII